MAHSHPRKNITLSMDKLVDSPVCDSNACYESEFQTQDGVVKTWLCMTSGYTSNTTMTLDSEGLKQTLELTADLVKDLRQDHEPPGGGEVLAWFPTCITMPDKGMIFPEPVKGTSTLEGKSVRHIDSVVRVTGMKTGYSVDIPVRFVKSIIS